MHEAGKLGILPNYFPFHLKNGIFYGYHIFSIIDCIINLPQINGESVIGVAHSKAAALIRQAQSNISLVVARPVAKGNTSFNLSQVLDDEEERQNSVDTDSDVDSTTFDDDLALGGKSHFLVG